MPVLGSGAPCPLDAPEPIAAPVPAPTNPSNAAAPNPRAKTAPIPGTASRVAAATPAEGETAHAEEPKKDEGVIDAEYVDVEDKK